MSGQALALVLGAAVLHAAWNALSKSARDPLAFLFSSMLVASALLLPAALWQLQLRGLDPAAVPCLVATALIHAVYFYALAAAYRAAEFSQAYPIARGLGVALVPILAAALLGERLSLVGASGVGLVVLGIVLVAHGRRAAASGPSGRTGIAWAAVTGLAIAGYSLVDKAGVARLHPVPYVTLLGAGSQLLLAPIVLRRREALRAEWRERWRALLAASLMNLTAYLLVLFAFRLAKTGYVVAARELSIVLGAVIGRLWLREEATRGRLAGAAVILGGVVCVTLAR